MRAVIQRVSEARVEVADRTVGSIGAGLLLLVAVENTDDDADVEALVDKVAGLRIFGDEQGKMNRSIIDIEGELLLVSQFTLAADVRRGRRPSFTRAARGPIAEPMIETIAEAFRDRGITTETGQFGAFMDVGLVNDGPVTIILDIADGAVL